MAGTTCSQSAHTKWNGRFSIQAEQSRHATTEKIDSMGKALSINLGFPEFVEFHRFFPCNQKNPRMANNGNSDYFRQLEPFCWVPSSTTTVQTVFWCPVNHRFRELFRVGTLASDTRYVRTGTPIHLTQPSKDRRRLTQICSAMCTTSFHGSLKMQRSRIFIYKYASRSLRLLPPPPAPQLTRSHHQASFLYSCSPKHHGIRSSDVSLDTPLTCQNLDFGLEPVSSERWVLCQRSSDSH